jgi:putative flippase GtrA
MKLSFRTLAAKWRASATGLKILSFGLIGIGNTAIDFGVFVLAYKVLGFPIIISNVIAWLVAVSGSYILNTLITFRIETGKVLRLKDYINFVLSGTLGMVATTTTLAVLSLYVPVITAKLISILVGFAVNFTMSNFFVFRPRHSTVSVIQERDQPRR